MSYSFLKKFGLPISAMLGCLFNLDAGQFNVFEHVPNPENSVPYIPINHQAEMIAALRTRGTDQLNVNECLADYTVHTNIYRPHNSVIESEISTRVSLSESINLTSHHKFLPSEELGCLETADELAFWHNWHREMTNEEFYCSIHYLQEEVTDPFTVLTVYTRYLTYLYKKAYGSLHKALELGYFNDSSKHVANFCRYVNKSRTLLYETQAFEANWKHANADWTQYDYVWPHIFRNNAMLGRHGEVLLDDYINNILATEALISADMVIDLIVLFSGMF